MKVTMYQRESTIYCRVSHKKDMVRLSTGIKIPYGEKFSDVKERFVGQSVLAVELNKKLDVYRGRVNDDFERMGSLGMVKAELTKVEASTEQTFDFYKLCTQYVAKITSGEIKTKQKTRFKLNSIRAYSHAVTQYGLFCKQQGLQLNYYDLTGKELKDKQMLAEEFKKHFNEFVEYLIKNKFSINSRAGFILVLTIIMNYYGKTLFMHLPSIESHSKYAAPIIALPDDFIGDFVADTDGKYQGLNDKLKFAWEVCTMMLVTSLRVGDAIALKPVNFTIINNEAFLLRPNQKTGADTLFPLAPSLARLVARNIKETGRVYTHKLSESKLRIVMPELFKMYTPMHQVISFKETDIHGETKVVSAPYWEIVHPHMMRKTCITSMLGNGVDENFVKFASGHVENSAAFEKYRGFSDRIYNEQIKNYQRKQFGE
jgi:hypothetical protein